MPTCLECNRTYHDDCEPHARAWRHTRYCSQYCQSATIVTSPADDRDLYKPQGADPFAWLIDKGERVYTRLLDEWRVSRINNFEFDGVYWRGQKWTQTSPFAFASAFADEAAENMFMTNAERADLLEGLCEATNFVRYGGVFA